jgi:modification methylase
MSDAKTVAKRGPSPPPPSVWITGQRDGHAQLAHGEYIGDTALDQDRIPPALAAYAITHYTHPGALVLDPDCGAGTVLVEALRAGRHAVGLTTHHRYWELARANLTTTKHAGAWPDGMVLEDTPTTQTDRTDHLTGLTGRVDLILTTPRHHTPSLAHTRPPDLDPLGTLTRALLRCRGLLHPGGHVVITLPPQRHHGQLLDLTRGTMAAGHAAGLLAVERCVALLAELRGIRIITRASLAQRRAAAQHQRLTGHPITLTAHHDVLVFRAPESAEQIVTKLTTAAAGLDTHLSRDDNTGHPLGGSGLKYTTTHRHVAASSMFRREAA